MPRSGCAAQGRCLTPGATAVPLPNSDSRKPAGNADDTDTHTRLCGTASSGRPHLPLVGVLISERASRTVLSTAVLCPLGGFVLGQGVLGVVPISPGDPVVGVLAQLDLFSVLYTDGMKVGLAAMIARTGAGQARNRLLPSRLMVYYVMAMALLSAGSY